MFLALLAFLSPPQDVPVEDVITVRAVKGKCRVQLAGALLTDQQFDARTRDWANGRPVQVIEPRGADYKCLAKLVLRLNDRGVTLVRFVDAPPR